MESERSLPDQWQQIIAARLSLPVAQLDDLLRKNKNFREICMDYSECAAAVSDVASQSPVNFRRIQEYRSIEKEIMCELHNLVRKIA